MNYKYYLGSFILLALYFAIEAPLKANSRELLQDKEQQTQIIEKQNENNRTRENRNQRDRRNIKYKKPINTEKIQQQTRAGGSRSQGCSSPLKISKLYLIAPQDHVGLTDKKRPTFYLYLDKIPTRAMRYSLNSQKELVFQKTINIKQKGIIPIRLPEGVELKEAGEYYLTIGLICEEKKPIKDFHASIKFIKINSKEMLSNNLSSANLWYDILDEVYRSNNRALFMSLTNQIGFDDLEFSP